MLISTFTRDGWSGCNLYVPQVLRYFALGSGLIYGYIHHNSLATVAETKRVESAYKHKEDLITKAKAAYAQSKLPASEKTGDGKSE